MPFMNFKIVNAKNIKMEFKKLLKKLKIQEKHMVLTCLLMFSPHTTRHLFYLELKHKIQLLAGRLRRKLKVGYMLHKKKPLTIK